MRSTATATRLLAATALCALGSPALAQDYGLVSTDSTPVNNPNVTTLQGAKTGVLSTGSSLDLTNAGTLRGDGHAISVFGPNGGVIISGGPAAITNSGSISGWANGISTSYFTNPDNSTIGLAIGSAITNSGSIIGENDDGIRLIGGGSVNNSGYIAGRVGVGADGISMFAYNGQNTTGITSLGTVTNQVGGVIEGNRYGVIIFGPGSIDNAGIIDHSVSVTGSPQFSALQVGSINNSGTILNGQLGLASLASGTATNSGLTPVIGFAGVGTANVTNSGTVTYFTSFDTVNTATVNNSGSIGEALIFNRTTTANVTNSGSITATNTTDVVGTTHDALYSGATLGLTNTSTGSITGYVSGVHADLGAATIDNAGVIRGNGTSTQFGSPNAGIVATGGALTLNNSGTISGNRFGVTTFGTSIDPNTGALSGTAIGSTVTNSGSIVGDNDDGVRLIGGGSVINSGTIAGRVTSGADGVSMFAYNDQATTAQIGSVTNLVGGTIQGNRLAIILSGGGTITNAGTLNGGTTGAILIQTGFVNGKTGAVTNSGTINGNVRLLGLDSSALDNSGSITGSAAGSAVLTDGPIVMTNSASGSITGAASGVFSSGATFSINNAGSIRGNGNGIDFNAPQGGILITGGPGTVNNTGSISGQRFGVSTFGFQLASGTNQFEGRAVGTTVTNGGSIIGDTDDGVRLIGGGIVNNSGYIAGRLGSGADGVSMFPYADQNSALFSSIGTLNNALGGTIEGNRFGAIFSGGGTINNAGTLGGGAGGFVIQATDGGKIGTVSNSGTINGTAQFNGLASASVTNSGTIGSLTGPGSWTTAPSGSLSIDNTSTGSITGATQGIFSEGSSLTVTNAGTIRGNGTSNLIRSAGAGILLTGGPGAITNSGTISGARFGITTGNYTDPVTNAAPGLAIGTTVSNSGTIIGENDDGVRLIGGGSVTNSGTISGRVTAGADGVSMFAYEDQVTTPQIGTITNLVGGTIQGARFGIIQSGGGTINNAGTISGGTNGAILIQTGFVGGKTANVTNSNLINGSITFNDLASSSLINSGSISDYVQLIDVMSGSINNSGSINASVNDAIRSNSVLSLTNNAGATITGAASGIFDHGLGLTVRNFGTIRGNGDIGIAADGGPATIINSGTLYGLNSAILTFGSAVGSTVSNTGTISSDNGVAVNLLSGSVTNSGTITGAGYGVQINSGTLYQPTVTNQTGGLISAINLADGGVVTNSGRIGSAPSTNVGINFGALGSGKSASLTTNAGSFTNGRVVVQDQASATILINGRIDLGTSGYAIGDQTVPKAIASNSPTTLTVGTTGRIFNPIQLSDLNDTVILKQGSDTSWIEGRNGSDTARLEGTNNSRSALTLVPYLSNFETVQITGGYWRQWVGSQTYGSTTISNGTLEIGGGTLTSPISVNLGGTLAGNDATLVGNVTVNNGGIVNPGGSYNGTLLPRSTLTVNGNMIFSSGGAYAVNISPNGTSDRLVVNGAVTINAGATLQVLAGIATYSPTTTSYTIITATGGVSGKFDKAVTDYAYYNASVNYQKKGTVTLNITPNGKPLPSAATASTFSTASAVESLGITNAIYQKVLVQSLTGARQAFSALSGSAYSRLDGLMSQDLGRVQLAQDVANTSPNLRWTGARSLTARGAESGQSLRSGKITLMMVGGRQATRLATADLVGNVDTRFLTSAAALRSNRFQAMASLTSAWHDVSVARTVAFPGFSDHHAAHYSASSQRFDLEGAYSLGNARLGLLPYAGFALLKMQSKPFIENGGASALSFSRDDRSVDQLRVGVRLNGTFGIGKLEIAPHLDASMSRFWGDVAPARQTRFVSGRSNFNSIGDVFDDRMIAVDAGVDVKVGRMTLTGSYRGRLGNRWRDHSAVMRASLPF